MSRCLLSILSVVLLLVSSGVQAQPALPGSFIRDLQSLEARLAEAPAEVLVEVQDKARRQAERLAAGNVADRWARALYLQLAAGAAARQGEHGRAAAWLDAAAGSDPAPAAWRQARRREAALQYRAAGRTALAVERLTRWLDETAPPAMDERWRLIAWLAELERWEAAAARLEALDAASGAWSADRRALALSIYRQAGHESLALALLREHLEREADPTQWRRAAALAQRLGDPGLAAALWEVGWQRGHLTGKEDLLRLARLHLAGGTPARAAEHLERGLEDGVLAIDARHRRLLATAWEAARDHGRALSAWEAVARESERATDWLRLGQLARGWGEKALAGRALRRARALGAEEAEAWLATLPDAAGEDASAIADQSESSVQTGA
ncbi:hypothetical protein [Halomonas saccharevitans]|uniref:Tetratricopeptide repeat-containing protein n=1 Tax=Halomonas saccharevitans TaxID=416872 RepID=A0A1I6X4M2_9GAMM|nr:hypothetical protein [Halomonas saccharevitans]SFT33275.1 hypothetical protein SAMN04487956_101185 [Halomonas saccharevitans]